MHSPEAILAAFKGFRGVHDFTVDDTLYQDRIEFYCQMGLTYDGPVMFIMGQFTGYPATAVVCCYKPIGEE